MTRSSLDVDTYLRKGEVHASSAVASFPSATEDLFRAFAIELGKSLYTS
jgi:hypothetical protein